MWLNWSFHWREERLRSVCSDDCRFFMSSFAALQRPIEDHKGVKEYPVDQNYMRIMWNREMGNTLCTPPPQTPGANKRRIVKGMRQNKQADSLPYHLYHYSNPSSIYTPSLLPVLMFWLLMKECSVVISARLSMTAAEGNRQKNWSKIHTLMYHVQTVVAQFVFIVFLNGLRWGMVYWLSASECLAQL